MLHICDLFRYKRMRLPLFFLDHMLRYYISKNLFNSKQGENKSKRTNIIIEFNIIVYPKVFKLFKTKLKLSNFEDLR